MEEKRLKEDKVKLEIGDWLTNLGFKVFDEKKNAKRPEWEVFKVINVNRGKRPDLIVKGNLIGGKQIIRDAYIAIEIKPGYKHIDLLNGFDETLDYFSDYFILGAEYEIEGKIQKISAFVLATLFSLQGFLFEEEKKYNPHGIVRGPWDAYPITFTFSRILWRQKDNLVKRYKELFSIPKIEKRLKSLNDSKMNNAEIGVLVQNPKNESVLLMLTENPYHWRLEP